MLKITTGHKDNWIGGILLYIIIVYCELIESRKLDDSEWAIEFNRSRLGRSYIIGKSIGMPK